MADGPAEGPRRPREDDDLNRPVGAEDGPGSDPGVAYELSVAAGDAPADEDEAPGGPGVAEVFRGGS